MRLLFGMLTVTVCLAVFLVGCSPADGSSPYGDHTDDSGFSQTEDADGAVPGFMGSASTTHGCSGTQEYKAFNSIKDYVSFVKSADLALLKETFTKLGSDFKPEFDASKFEMLLEHRQFVRPVLPSDYTIQSLVMATYDPLTVNCTYQDTALSFVCYLNTADKWDGHADKTFRKKGDIAVIVDYFPNTDGGTCLWEENGYQCAAIFNGENEDAVLGLVKELEMRFEAIA